MQLKLILLTVALVAAIGPADVSASFWDSIPIISQIKSAVQAISGDTEGAKKTQENFVNQAPVVSQIKSAVQSASGDNEGAKKTQEQFLHEFIEPVADNTPIVGHIKGGIHIAAGDKERGEHILKGASTSTAAVIGGILGGPAGAIAAGAATDGLITGIDSAKNREYSPFGIVDYVSNIDKHSAGDHFDTILGIGTEFVGGKAAKKGGKKPGFGAEAPPKRGFSDRFGPESIFKTAEEEGRPTNRRRLNTDIPESRMDLSNPTHLEIARQRTGLADGYAQRLEPADFRVVNDVQGNMNCYYCSLAALKRKTVTELLKETEVMMEAKGAPSIKYIVDLYKEAGFQNAKQIFEGTPEKFYAFLDNNIANGEIVHFSLPFRRNDGTGHVVHARAWKTPEGTGHLLITDFQQPPFSIGRFATRLPDNLKTVFVISVALIRELGDLDAASRSKIYQTHLAALKEQALAGGNKCAKRIIGYVTHWTWRPFTIKQSLGLTNAIYAFIDMDASGRLSLPSHSMSRERLIDLVLAKKVHMDQGLSFKVSFAIGGWENSKHFSAVLSGGESRNTLINEIDRIMNLYQFDGVDIDWEYPVTGGATEGKPEDKGNYVTFLRELRAKLGANRLISIAAAAGQEAFAGFDVPNLLKHVDWIGVMSYDFFGAWDSQWGAFVGPNSPLKHAAPTGYSGKLNVDWAIKQYECNGNDPAKIVMGVPFYGRFWHQTSPGKDPNYPLYRTAERLNNGSYGGSAPYWEVLNEWHLNENSAFQKNWDARSSTPWATDGKLVLSYENERSIAEKIKYANEHNLGGVMIWSVDQDSSDFVLIDTVFKTGCKGGSGGGIKYKCNPLGTEKRWWTWLEDKDKAGMCGKMAPLHKGFYPLCDPDDPGFSCCSPHGYCGSGEKFCDCEDCVNYAEHPEKLVEAPVKPTRPVQWHVGFDIAKVGQPRCGPNAPKLPDGKEAICNPDGKNFCCSPAGYCGSGDDFCECDGCVNHRTGKKAGQSGDKRWYTFKDGLLAGRCGPSAPKIDGHVPICNPKDPAYHCCSASGYCGAAPEFCSCKGCVDYSERR
uniref:Chitinase-like protein n=1 Tax=Bemisia tabaci TaxID=7038 RepID=A0A8K1UAP8_BEMTA|nr:chitinase-like protein [Bemisia tabaci]